MTQQHFRWLIKKKIVFCINSGRIIKQARKIHLRVIKMCCKDPYLSLGKEILWLWNVKWCASRSIQVLMRHSQIEIFIARVRWRNPKCQEIINLWSYLSPYFLNKKATVDTYVIYRDILTLISLATYRHLWYARLFCNLISRLDILLCQQARKRLFR